MTNNKENNIKPKVQDLTPSERSIGSRVNTYIKDTAIPKFSILFEDYGKTILFFLIILIVIIIFVASFGIKFKDKNNNTSKNQQQSTVVQTNSDLDNDLAYAGFSANYKDLNFRARIQTTNNSIDKVQIYNDKINIDIQSFLFPVPKDTKGLNPSLPEVINDKNIVEFLALKDRKFGLSSPVADPDKKTTNYRLLDLSSKVDKNSIQTFAYQYPILAPTTKNDSLISKSEIGIQIRSEGLSDELI